MNTYKVHANLDYALKFSFSFTFHKRFFWIFILKPADRPTIYLNIKKLHFAYCFLFINVFNPFETIINFIYITITKFGKNDEKGHFMESK